MRLRLNSAEAGGLGVNSPPDRSGRAAGGRGRFKFPKLWGGQRGQGPERNTSTTDGTAHQAPEPKEVAVTLKQLLEAGRLCEAGRLLTNREEDLFGGTKEAEALAHHEEEAEKLTADYRALEGHVVQTLKLSLSPGEVSTEALTSAVKAISQEEDQDERWKQRNGTPPAPAWRPRGWKKLHDATLGGLVAERMDNPSTPPADQQSSIQADVNSMGRQLKDDLLLLVGDVKRCYPPQWDVCNLYAGLYHQNFSARLRKIAEFVLGDKDATFLLRWVNEYYPGILRKAELAGEIDADALGKLLPEELLEPLEEQYLSRQEGELTTFIGRVLEEAKEKWNKGEEPPREDGCFVSTVAYDIIQVVNGSVTSAEKVVGDRRKAQSVAVQLRDSMQSFRSFQNDVIKQNKANSSPFLKANLGCVEQFSDVLQNKSQLFPQDVSESCLKTLSHMTSSAHAHLLKPVHEALKPHYRKMGTSDWLKKPLCEKLLVCLEHEGQDLQGSAGSCHQKLIGQLHQEVTAEYVRRLMKGEVKLKDREQQLQAYRRVKEDAESLHDSFFAMGSKEGWLKEILTEIAEVLKLQDLPAIQMHMVSLGTAFPDLSERHASALLKLKTNFSRADRRTVKETLSDALKETSCSAARPFFSTIRLK